MEASLNRFALSTRPRACGNQGSSERPLIQGEEIVAVDYIILGEAIGKILKRSIDARAVLLKKAARGQATPCAGNIDRFSLQRIIDTEP